MKKNLILIAMLIFSSILHAQEKINRWEVGSGFSFGAYLGNFELTIMNANINLEGEYYVSKPISVVGHVDYNRSFATREGTSSVGFATTHIGPRFHFANVFFVGVGLGALLYVDQSGNYQYLSYNPQVGAVFNKIELSFGYKGWSNGNLANGTGMLELGLIFKVNRVRL